MKTRKKGEKWKLKKSLHKSPSKRLFRHSIHSLLR